MQFTPSFRYCYYILHTSLICLMTENLLHHHHRKNRHSIVAARIIICISSHHCQQCYPSSIPKSRFSFPTPLKKITAELPYEKRKKNPGKKCEIKKA
eukprot:12092.XXX_124284_122973_1 [CDS] Oithona nana genome sequencing.